jgi:hypothetical protein
VAASRGAASDSVRGMVVLQLGQVMVGSVMWWFLCGWVYLKRQRCGLCAHLEAAQANL